jgi:hypothetical protein
MRSWKRFVDSHVEPWDLRALVLVVVMLIAGFLIKLDEAWWAIAAAVVLCLGAAAARHKK